MLEKKQIQSRKKTGELGFSLLELMVGITIFIIVTGSIYGLLEVGRQDRNRTSRRTDTEKNARIAMYLIGRDVMNAGLGYHKTGGLVPDDFMVAKLGTPAETGSTRDLLTSVTCGNDVYSNNFLPTGFKTDSIAFVYRDLDFNNGKPVVVTDEIGSGTKVVLKTNAADLASINVYDLVMAETKTSQIIALVTSKDTTNNYINIDSGLSVDILGVNQPRNGGTNGSLLRKCTSSTDTTCTAYDSSGIVLKKIEMVSYKVKADGTLVKIIYGNNKSGTAAEQIQERAISYGVQNFQLTYQMKDGTVVNDPVMGADAIRGTADDTQENMNNVRQVTIALKVSSTENDERTGQPEIIVLRSSFALRNMTYDDK